MKGGHILGAVHAVRTPPTILEALRADEVAPSLITLAILLFLLPLPSIFFPSSERQRLQASGT